MWLVLGVACSGDPVSGDDVVPTVVVATSETGAPPTDTDTGTAPPGELTAACALQPGNVLRADCTVTTPVDEPVTLEVDGRTFASPGGTTHALTVWGLRPEADYTWTASSASGEVAGTVRTGALPFPFAVAVTGASTAEHLLLGLDDFVVIADVAGQVVWYQQVERVGGLGTLQGVTGYDFSEEDGLVALHVDGRRLLAYDLSGREVLRLERGVDFDDVPLHHDLNAARGRIHALFAERVTLADGDYVLDGVLTVGVDGSVLGTWRHADHLTEVPFPGTGFPGFWAQEFPGAAEWGHANSVFAADDEDWIVSLRAFDRVIRVDGATGTITWTLQGDGGGDFVVASAPGVTANVDFIGQHHAAIDGARVTLFDNRTALGARTVALDLDEVAGTATIVETHALGRACTIQGGNHVLPNGNVLATCATSSWAAEYAAGSPEDAAPIWTLALSDHTVNRFVPVDLPR